MRPCGRSPYELWSAHVKWPASPLDQGTPDARTTTKICGTPGTEHTDLALRLGRLGGLGVETLPPKRVRSSPTRWPRGTARPQSRKPRTGYDNRSGRNDIELSLKLSVHAVVGTTLALLSLVLRKRSRQRQRLTKSASKIVGAVDIDSLEIVCSQLNGPFTSPRSASSCSRAL